MKKLLKLTRMHNWSFNKEKSINESRTKKLRLFWDKKQKNKLKSSLSRRELKMKNRNKYKDFESFNKKHLIDNLSLTHYGQKEQLKQTRELLVKNSASKPKFEQKGLNNYRLLDWSNKNNVKKCCKSKLEQKKQNFKMLYENRKKSVNYKKSYRNRKKLYWRSMQINLKSK